MPFFNESGLAGVFKKRYMVFGDLPGVTILSSGEQSATIDVTGTKVFFNQSLNRFFDEPQSQ